MKYLGLTLAFILSCALLVATPFDDFINQTGEEISQQTKLNCAAVVIVDKFELSGNINKTETLTNYFRETIHTKLSGSQSIKLLSMATTDKIMAKHAKAKRDLFYYNDISFQIYKELNQTPDGLLSCRITDLDTKLKFELVLKDVNNLSDLAKLVVEYPADDQTDALLGKVREEYVYDTPEDDFAFLGDDEGQYISVATDSGEFFEDFSAYKEGDSLSDWGKGLIVYRDKVGKKYLSSQIKGSHKAAQQFLFPSSFALQLDFLKHDGAFTITLIDTTQQEVKIQVDNSWGDYKVKISGTVDKKIPALDLNTLRITRSGKTIKVYLNGQFMVSGDYQDFHGVCSFVLNMYEGQKYTDIKVEKI